MQSSNHTLQINFKLFITIYNKRSIEQPLNGDGSIVEKLTTLI